jgi:hypothetical protein
MKIKLFQGKFPKEPGYYLFRGGFSNEIDLIRVVKYPKTFEFGIEWDEYLGIANWRGKKVQNLIGFFSDKLELE